MARRIKRRAIGRPGARYVYTPASIPARNYFNRQLKSTFGAKTFKLRAVSTLASDVAGVIKMTVTDDPTGLQDWSSCGALFDMYKVESVKITYIPELPNDPSTTTGYFPFYVCFDPDSGAANPVTSVNIAIQYDNMKIKNLYRPWTYKKKIPQVTSVAGASAIVVHQGGFIDIGSATAVSGLYGYGTSFDVSTTYGNLIYDFVITFKSRR